MQSSMIGLYVLAEDAYRRERISADFSRTRRQDSEVRANWTAMRRSPLRSLGKAFGHVHARHETTA